MFTLKNLPLTTASSTLIFFATTLPSAAVSFYSITELPFTPSDINDNGQIVGGKYLWDNGTLIDFSTRISEEPTITQLTAINNPGKIVGYWILGSFNTDTQSFIFDGTNITKINSPSNNCGSIYTCRNLIIEDINEAGQMTIRDLPNPQLTSYGVYGFLRDVDGTFINLFFDRNVYGMALNNSTQVIANTGSSYGKYSYFYSNGKKTLLFPSEVSRKIPVSSSIFHFIPLNVTSINDRGQIVGFGNIGDNLENIYSSPTHGLLWNNPEQNPVGTDLGTLEGSYSVYSQANSINNLGQIVGASGTNSHSTSAVIWEENSIYDLNNLIDNNLGWQLTSALKINNKGQIIGSGNVNGQSRNFLLTPVSKSVPEPTSIFSLLGFAAFGMGWQIKRQRNQKTTDHLIS